MKTGIELIAEERARQVAVEGWTPEHDDEHDRGELAIVAAMLAVTHTDARLDDPHDAGLIDWHCVRLAGENTIRDLMKAGALIAAEIDRLQRAQPSPPRAES